MSPELDKYLVEKYPKIFRDRYEDMQKTAMCWGFEHDDGWFWILDNLCKSIQSYIDSNSKKKIIKNKFIRKVEKVLRKMSFKYSKFKTIRFLLKKKNSLLRKIANYIDDRSEKIEIETIPQVIATQVKEKFGGLNFYFNGGDDRIDGMVSFAEDLSYKTCEICGSTKNIGMTQGWLKCICKDCFLQKSNINTWKHNNKIYIKEQLLRRLKLESLK